MKYKNQHFPYDYDPIELRRKTEEFMQQSLIDVQGDHVNNIIYSIRAQLGLAEIHKRQNERSNCYILTIAIFSLILSLSAIYMQWKTATKPINIENSSLQEITNILKDKTLTQKLDSILFYFRNPVLPLDNSHAQPMVSEHHVKKTAHNK